MAQLHEILQKHWGYTEFRPLQREIIESVAGGRDTVALLPTGGGKSLTYQVPALALEGLTIVVTPLIALMKDQVDALRRRGINAVAVNSAMSAREVDIALNNCVFGDVKLLYIAPERIGTRMFTGRVANMNVSLVAVDEAHCISEWGYDFRPSYLEIKSLREVLPGVPFLAVTATATSQVLDDIVRNLDLEDPQVFRGSFARPNISFVVREGENKADQMLRVIRSVPGSGIVYVRTRRHAEEIAAALREEGIAAEHYHAGLDYRLRSVRQEAWLKGQIRVIVATNAFGMGIDKADVRFVIHHRMPDSVEAYYQEAGRAGRDGLKAYAVLMHDAQDTAVAGRRIDMEFPAIPKIREVYEALFNYIQMGIGSGREFASAFDLQAFSVRFKLFPLTAFNALKILEMNGYLTLTDPSESPTRIMFRIGREELYKLQVSRADLEGFIKALLRSYTGLFTELTAIDEEYLASRSGYTTGTVAQMLYQLSAMRVISYVPRRSTPLLILHENRVPAADVHIRPETYHRRREMSQLRGAAMAEYAENHTMCRSVMLREYFDEQGARPCGVCDVCLSRRDRGQFRTAEAFAGVEQQLTEALRTLTAGGRGATIHSLVASVPGRSMLVLTALRRLIAAGRIAQQSDGTLMLPD